MTFTPATLVLLADASGPAAWLLVGMSWALMVWNARRRHRRDDASSRSAGTWPICDERPERNARRRTR